MKQSDLRERLFSDDLIRRVFLYSFLCGIVAHGSVMTKALFWHDGLKCAYSVKINNAIGLGRWMRAFLAHIVACMFGGTNPSLPVFYGVVSLFFIAASAYLIIRMFNIQSRTMQLVLCGLMVSFPAVTSTFAYMFTAPYYFLGLFLATLAVFIARQWTDARGFAIGALCVSCSLGLYQAYIAVAASLFVMTLIFDIVNDRYPSIPRFLGRAFYCLGVLIVGLAVYYGIWMVCLKALNVTPWSYQGVSSIGQKGIGVYLKGISKAYRVFFLSDLTYRDNLYPMGLRTAQIIMIALSIVFSICLIVRSLRKNVLFGIVLALLIALLPLSFNLVYMLGVSSVHTVMLYGQCMLYVYLICAAMHVFRDRAGFHVACCRATVLALIILVAMDTFFDNGCYMKAEMMLQQTISNMTVLVAKIKTVEGYRDDMPVCISATGEKDATIMKNTALKDYMLVPWNMIVPYEKNFSTKNAKAILSRWCGFSPKYVTASKFGHKKEISKMPSYPDDGSVKIIDGTVVVRM